MRYSIKIEKEINLLASLIYAKLEEDGYHRMKIFFVEDLADIFKVKKQVIYRQLKYLRDFGYIKYSPAKENRAGKLRVLEVLILDGEVNDEAFNYLETFRANRLKIMSAMLKLGQATTNEVKYLLGDIPRATVSRLLLTFHKEGVLDSLEETYKGSNKENTWRLIV